MLRITTLDEFAPTATLKVEGRIVDGWIAALERECGRLLESGRAIDLDLSAVSFVDARGLAMLKNLLAANVRITRCSDLIQSLIHQEHPP